MANEGDFVRVPLGISVVGQPSNYGYGKVIEIQSSGFYAKVELSKPYLGAIYTSVPKYLAKKITEEDYGYLTRGHPVREDGDCDHNWIYTGQSAVFKDKWYDCKICGKQKGG